MCVLIKDTQYRTHNTEYPIQAVRIVGCLSSHLHVDYLNGLRKLDADSMLIKEESRYMLEEVFLAKVSPKC